MTSDVIARVEELLYDHGVKPGVPAPDIFRAVGREIPVEERPKEIQIIRFDGENKPKPKGDRISIVPINDIHYGSSSANRLKFEEYLSYILKTDDTYTTGVGDLIENATKMSVGMAMFEEVDHLPQQLDYIASKLEPLAKAGKLLGLQPGNHEQRTANMIGMDPMQIIAKWINVPYLGWQAYWNFDVAGQEYTALTYHGSCGAGTKGGKINAVRKLNQIANVDLYVMGHVHDQQYDFDEIFELDKENGKVVRRRRHYVIAGSLLSYFGGYPEMAAYSPGPMGLARIDMLKDRKEIQVHF